MMKGEKKNGLYVLQVSIVNGSAFVAKKNAEETTKLWHSKLGHVSGSGLFDLEKHRRSLERSF